MIRSIVTLAAVSLLLAGCAMQDHHGRHAQHMADMLHARPVVTVRGGLISVAPEPIVVFYKQRREPLVWQLPEGYRFARDGGIQFLGVIVGADNVPLRPTQDLVKDPKPRLNADGAKHFACTTDAKVGREVRCELTDNVVRGAYRYAIRVEGPDGKTIVWDPTVFAMD